MRDAFSDEFVVVLDERDKVALDDQTEEPNDDAPFTRMEEVKLTSRVCFHSVVWVMAHCCSLPCITGPPANYR